MLVGVQWDLERGWVCTFGAPPSKHCQVAASNSVSRGVKLSPFPVDMLAALMIVGGWVRCDVERTRCVEERD